MFRFLRSAFRIVAAPAVLFVSVGMAQADTSVAIYEGNYRVSPDHTLGVDRFVNDAGESVLLFSDYQSGIVRQLFPVSANTFVMGPGFATKSPPELTVTFQTDAQGTVTGLSLQTARGAPAAAQRVPLLSKAVTFRDGDVKLAGTLEMPATAGAHPGIILLHGSGPLTRNSFGPYPHFFTSLGFAVLTYDKRGTGASTGVLFDASTALAKSPSAEHYPDALADDALAAMRFLRTQRGVDSRKIGFWGSSEGGMLTTQVAARAPDVAFIVDSSGFMGPLWQTLRYQISLRLRDEGLSPDDVRRAAALTDMWLNVARTGKGWNAFVRTRDDGLKNKAAWVTNSSQLFSSQQQLRWVWDHVLSFDPLPALKHVTCPVLAVYGEKDDMTEIAVAAPAMRAALADNKDVTIKVFPNAGHSLAEMPSGSRMAPGLFETLRAWLLRHTKDR